MRDCRVNANDITIIINRVKASHATSPNHFLQLAVLFCDPQPNVGCPPIIVASGCSAYSLAKLALVAGTMNPTIFVTINILPLSRPKEIGRHYACSRSQWYLAMRPLPQWADNRYSGTNCRQRYHLPHRAQARYHFGRQYSVITKPGVQNPHCDASFSPLPPAPDAVDYR